MRRALFQLFASASLTISAISAGISFEATDTSPAPPTEITGRAMGSSPQNTLKLLGTRLISSVIWLSTPLDSFAAWIVGTSCASRAIVFGSRLQPVRLGMLYLSL